MGTTDVERLARCPSAYSSSCGTGGRRQEEAEGELTQAAPPRPCRGWSVWFAEELGPLRCWDRPWPPPEHLPWAPAGDLGTLWARKLISCPRAALQEPAASKNSICLIPKYEHLMSAYCVLGTVLGAGNSKTQEAHLEFTLQRKWGLVPDARSQPGSDWGHREATERYLRVTKWECWGPTR